MSASYGGDPRARWYLGRFGRGELAHWPRSAQMTRRGGPGDMADVTHWSVRGAMAFYGVLEMIGDESHWRGLGRGLADCLLERRIVQVPYDGK